MNIIHPTAIIGDNVILGTGNYIGAYTVIGGEYMHEGGDNRYKNGMVVIGDGNTIAHHVTILSPYRTSLTSIGNHNNIYSQNFIGHDANIGDYVIMTAACRLAGVVTIENDVNLGIGTKIHQRKRIGRGAMLGMGCVVTKDVLPFDKVVGVPAHSIGLNTIGIERLNLSYKEVEEIRQKWIRQ